jgi:zinc D-Ala-D-Ala carboxypeptidase
VTDNRTVLLAALMLVALSAWGCGTSESPAATEGSPDGIPQIWPAGDRRAHADRSGPLDTSQPTIGNLDPDLLAAVQAAARDAQDVGLTMAVTSGWRSRAHQQRLFDEGVSKYGSEEEASRWVSTPDTSAHVTGDAVDIGPTAAAEWLSQHGTDYGLCQVFANEIWHYELATTPGGQCPAMYPDSSYRN